MKGFFSLLCVLICFSVAVQAQQPWLNPRYQHFDGADTVAANSILIYKDSTQPVNSWQIGAPQKTHFQQAFTPPNAMVTDTLAAYPANDSSLFGFRLDSLPFYGILAIRWLQKLNYDSLHHDGGYVEYQINSNGWQNALLNPFSGVYSFYGFLQSNVDTLANGQMGFTGTDTVWRDIWLCFKTYTMSPSDTIHIRYVSVSDSDSVRGDGWMIDNLMVRPTMVHTVTKLAAGGNAALYPQPSSGDLTIEADNSQTEQYLLSVKLMDYAGHPLEAYRLRQKRMQLDLSAYPDGVYLVEVKAEKSTATHRIVLKR